MHVHGSWSEGLASWHTQLENAQKSGLDVIYLTDHDHHALAVGYLDDLATATWTRQQVGDLAQNRSETTGKQVQLTAESNQGTAAVTLAIAERPTAFAQLRTSIAGQILAVEFHDIGLGPGAAFDIGIALSLHPAGVDRSAGQLQLAYRFGDFTDGATTQADGRVGIITAPTPAPGQSISLRLDEAVARLWPDVLASDNSFYGLAFTATSSGPGSVADIRLSADFIRQENDALSVQRNRAALVDHYQGQYQGLAIYPSYEYNPILEHMNAFGIGQYLPDYSYLTKERLRRNELITDDLQSRGALVSLNHPMGFEAGSLLPPADQARKRRAVFQRFNSVACFGVDILEVGYAVRARVSLNTHAQLWDTFSRNGNFLTGTGVNDDHNGNDWLKSRNGYATGVWSSSSSQAAIIAALAAGRAYFFHPGRWPQGAIDLMLDGIAQMGSVTVSGAATRELGIWVRKAPPGALLQVIAGPVDYADNPDPGTVVVRTLSLESAATNALSITIDSGSDSFYRVQLITRSGEILGSSNPVWVLRSEPPGGIPLARRL